MLMTRDSAGPRARGRRRRRLSPLTVFGELLLVAGVGVLGYIVWQPWHTALTVGGLQQDLSAEVSAAWDEEATEGSTEGMPVADRASTDEIFAVLHVPAFGLDYANSIAESTSWDTVLNSADIGIGHYEMTQMPGEAGNFAVAAHRSGPITTPFKELMNLRLGDEMFVETKEGWYTYRFRSIEFTTPDAGDVLNPFPRIAGTPGEDQILTLTTCHPKHWGNDERAIAYAVLDDFQPRADGEPEALTAYSEGGATEA